MSGPSPEKGKIWLTIVTYLYARNEVLFTCTSINADDIIHGGVYLGIRCNNSVKCGA